MLHRWAADLAHLPLLSGAVPVLASTAAVVVTSVLAVAVVLRVRRGRALGAVFGPLSALGLVASLLLAATVLTNLTVTRYPTVAVALGHRPAVTEGTGRLVDVDVPGTVSHFAARPATVYVPASYDAGASDLPVLVLLTGQPGHVVDWIEGGRLAQTMDAFAARHGGAAPIVVVADGLGDTEANPMCMDSNLGNAATYLSVDVPHWIRSNFRVSSDPRAWAVGGYSYGGTCALQLAVTAPSVYPTFLDISGEDEQRRGTRSESVAAAYGTDTPANEERFERMTPLNILSRTSFPDSAGAFVVGADDEEFRPQTERTYRAAETAGLDVHYSELPGGHSMQVWAPALEQEMDWLGERVGLLD
ncbi:alpha/beta hydrolase-fold protein [Rhodococcus sp. IEGM 1401]|uniref:alpha/beta hydrolase n=1 Tax=unclassified Rhodococcus (in: high G+C Gram-positive bacteria) TaxID=192944 RepID=UPI0022B487E6|nr:MULTISPECIES: alpha/beta hydrolase-fold protein [unclassified Rhodococcus (in: high G+C Gram-positive bacteria)]MCZ4559471.1 alpha/beta hydrolase-fold protein [Rhodococcus sp. IEGM 1401]MDI9919576.1 alpha/beta hydrolase-fold protein [Rhodococcus sp. IEGM 1372]MDV8032051.1 alpha/beta hydrolase-fold protein [Rhodococcus sp. IEGM 1414]